MSRLRPGRLNLRSRLLAGLVLVAVLQIGVGFVVITTTRNHLVEQIDARLAAARDPSRDARVEGAASSDGDPLFPAAGRKAPPNGLPDRLGDTFEGILRADGTLQTYFAPNSTGTELPPPVVDLALARSISTGSPITVRSATGDVRYRATARATGTGEFLVTAIPLSGVEDTVNRLIAVMASAVALITIVLALVAWWVIRLGIRPIKRMTAAAGAIAAGDLAERIDGADESTEAGQLAGALNRMLGRLEGSFAERVRTEERLRRFVADASHELRTPVATIRGYAELYRQGGLGGEGQMDDAMRRTEQESQRMSRLIDDMLDLAKLDQHPELAIAPVDLGAIAEDVAADARAVQPRRPITTEVTPCLLPGGLWVDGNEDVLRQAIGNVVGNALVHTDPTVAVRVCVRRADDQVIVAVTDFGHGMDEDTAARVTERFFRADPARSRHRGGSGLGLAIVDAAVQAHHGTLTVDSAPGVGTTVSIALPARAAPIDHSRQLMNGTYGS